MLPLWLLLLPLIFFGQPISFEVFAGNGEFALYSAGILSGTLYIIMKEIQPSKLLAKGKLDISDIRNRFKITFPNNTLLGTITIMLLVISAVIFMMMAFTNLLAEYLIGVSLNTYAFNNITFVIFVVALVLGFIIIGVDNSSMDRQLLLDMKSNQLEVLSDKFDELDEDD